MAGKRVALARRRDSQGRQLPVWHGCQVVGDGELFPLNRAPDSMDGRYFGYVPATGMVWVTGTDAQVPLELGWPQYETLNQMEYIQFTNGVYDVSAQTFYAGQTRVDVSAILNPAVPGNPGGTINQAPVISGSTTASGSFAEAAGVTGSATARVLTGAITYTDASHLELK